MLTPENLASLIANDSTFDYHNLTQDYSLSNLSTIQHHYDELHCATLTDDHLISNFFRFRLALNRPDPTLDYQPNTLREHNGLIEFTEAVLRQYEHEAFLINFSPALILIPLDENTPNRFLYSSTNFLCLENSILVHSEETLGNFLEVLKNFDLREYLADNERALSDKYNGAILLTVSLVFYITRQPNLYYGFSEKHQQQQTQKQEQEQQQHQQQQHQQQQQQQQPQNPVRSKICQCVIIVIKTTDYIVANGKTLIDSL